MSEKPVAVLGAGTFGTAVTNILAKNREVLFYARKKEIAEAMSTTRQNLGIDLHERVTPTYDLELIAKECDVIFPVVPSASFRSLIKQLSEHLHPYHTLIHGTKGLDLTGAQLDSAAPLTRDHIATMSEVILQESVVVRVGCLAGPNLARELFEDRPAATVVASHFDQVIRDGQRLLRNDRFQVYGNPDLIGVELCGVLKNIIAIASGALSGLKLGENARALLISRGLVEMIYLGKALGGNVQAFIGLAGVGDLVATCSSTYSRNYHVGYHLALGESLSQILENMEEVAEGVNTTRIMRRLAESHGVRAPITEALHKVMFEGMDINEAFNGLMRYPLQVDVNFL